MRNHKKWILFHSINLRGIYATKNTTIDGQVISDGELFFKAKYLFSAQENTNWCWKQQPLQQTITVPTLTIIHPRVYFITIGYVQDIFKNVCNRI